MPTFVLTYRTPHGYQVGTPEGMDRWKAWFQGMGSDLVDIGQPVAESATVGDCGNDIRPLGGYSLIKADDLDAALRVAKDCPFVDVGGGVEVGLLRDLAGVSGTR
jgi:hypothetical protein